MIVLARVTAPYGIKGWLKLAVYGDEPERWKEMGEIWLSPDPVQEAPWQPYPLKGLRPHGGGWVMKLGGIEDRTAAEALAGHYLAAPRARLPRPGEDEYYWADLIGLAVINERDEPLGRVVDLIETGAHDVLVVREGEGKNARERLIPFVAALVREVEPAAGKLRVAWEREW